MTTRRLRSDLTEADAIQEMKAFCKKITRMTLTSESFDGRGSDPLCQSGEIVFKALLNGDFVNADVTEAIRVLGEHKLPAKDGS